MPLHILSCLVVLGHFQHSNDLQLEMVWGGIVQTRVILLWTNSPSYALAHNYCYYHAYLSSSRFYFCLLWCHLRLRSCLFFEGRISVLKRWFKTPIQNALHGSTVHASLEKKTISWACTAYCSRLLFELKWTRKGVYMTSFKRGYMWFCVHASTRISVLL